MILKSKTVLFSYRNGNQPAFTVLLKEHKQITDTQVIDAVKRFYNTLYPEQTALVSLGDANGFSHVILSLSSDDCPIILDWTFLKTIEL